MVKRAGWERTPLTAFEPPVDLKRPPSPNPPTERQSPGPSANLWGSLQGRCALPPAGRGPAGEVPAAPGAVPDAGGQPLPAADRDHPRRGRPRPNGPPPRRLRQRPVRCANEVLGVWVPVADAAKKQWSMRQGAIVSPPDFFMGSAASIERCSSSGGPVQGEFVPLGECH